VRNIGEYTPITKASTLYLKVLARIVDVEKWDDREYITRQEFEKLLCNDAELENDYVDLFSLESIFIYVPFEITCREYRFYCMIINLEIELIYFKLQE
jgi:hypothetical protein